MHRPNVPGTNGEGEEKERRGGVRRGESDTTAMMGARDDGGLHVDSHMALCTDGDGGYGDDEEERRRRPGASGARAEVPGDIDEKILSSPHHHDHPGAPHPRQMSRPRGIARKH